MCISAVIQNPTSVVYRGSHQMRSIGQQITFTNNTRNCNAHDQQIDAIRASKMLSKHSPLLSITKISPEKVFQVCFVDRTAFIDPGNLSARMILPKSPCRLCCLQWRTDQEKITRQNRLTSLKMMPANQNAAGLLISWYNERNEGMSVAIWEIFIE